MPHRIIEYGSMPHLSRYYTLHVVVRGMRIWPPNAAKCCKNAGKFFPNATYLPACLPAYLPAYLPACLPTYLSVCPSVYTYPSMPTYLCLPVCAYLSMSP